MKYRAARVYYLVTLQNLTCRARWIIVLLVVAKVCDILRYISP